LDDEVKQIKAEALKITWYMRGGLTYDQSMMLSTAERETVNKIIKENLDTTKRTGLPFF